MGGGRDPFLSLLRNPLESRPILVTDCIFLRLFNDMQRK
jgi:hypothetical protein